jgi:hypothetical protein
MHAPLVLFSRWRKREVCCPLRVVIDNCWAGHLFVDWQRGVESDFHDSLWSSSTILSYSQRLYPGFLEMVVSSVIIVVQFWGTFHEKMSEWMLLLQDNWKIFERLSMRRHIQWKRSSHFLCSHVLSLSKHKVWHLLDRISTCLFP